MQVEQSASSFSSNEDRKRGVALISVIGVLSLATVLMLSVLASARSEMVQAAAGSGARQAGHFRDIGVNLVMAQIRKGTEIFDGGGWASQPGAIRRFDADGNPVKVFKLYSDNQMLADDFSSIFSDASELKSWKDYPARFVDMNEPVLMEEHMDGEPVMGSFFPIMDPRSLDVEGFDYDISEIPGGVRPGRNLENPNARLPMPVEWLYVLEDGTIGSLGNDNEFIGPKSPDRDNPIVGRVAFWTDDESCKVNINTASEGTHWSVPKNASREAIDFARFQPAQNEYQRYPGHPATTSLSPVLQPDKDFTWEEAERLYDVLARIPSGGSKSGTVVTDNNAGPLSTSDARLPLFATTDELALSVEREGNSLIVQNKNGVNEDVFGNVSLRRSEAFITAHSRAPELNLFGLPRVSIWPVSDSNMSSTRFHRTAFDNIIAFCSTLGPKLGRTPAPLYTFQRRNADSATEDYTNITRNQVLYNYLMKMTSKPVPGFGNATFANKYQADHPQILTQIFDYIRCVNLCDDNHPGATSGGNSNHTTFTDYRSGTGTGVTVGHGQVVPIRIGDTRGFGRFNSISELGFVVICCADYDYPRSNQVDGSNADGYPANPNLDGTQLEEGEIRIQPMILIEPFSPSQGWTQLADHMRYRLSGLSSLKIDEQPLYNTDLKEKTFTNSFWGGFHSQRTWGGTNGFRNASFDGLVGLPITVSKEGTMAFSGGTLMLEIASMESGTAEVVQTIELEFPPASLPKPVLVKAATPGGQVTQGGIGANSTNEEYWWSFNRGVNGNHRLHGRGQSPYYPWNTTNNPDKLPGEEYGPRRGAIVYSDEHDVVRSLVPPHGDYRLTSARGALGKGVFAPVEGYDNPQRMHAHIFHHNPAGSHWTDGYAATDLARQLVPGANYHHGKLPDFPPGAIQRTGDFDNGIAFVQDGAYINKPDEGNNHRGTYRGRDGGVAAPYFDQNWLQSAVGRTYFSPNRMICSPVFFGSLPVGVMRNIPWQTLLFRPQDGHPGESGVPDYALLDLFWMPVVDPWAISEPSSTAGKVNLNHQIVPFTYIERSTALRSVFKSTDITSVPKTAGDYYKIYDHEMADYYVPPVPPRATTYNLDIDADETLKQFSERFENGRVFRTGAEICDIHLVPQGVTLGAMESGSYWESNALTGDNVRERPYSYLHPRLTARSNAFRVHVRAQSISKARSSDPATFDPELDSVVAEYRGSTLVERYLRHDDEELSDYAANVEPFIDGADPGSPRPEELYVFRVISQKRFSPK